MIGKTISHFKILEKLGEGGMGEVYKAEDTNLDRIVALKFLPHHLLSGEEEKTRFMHEAKAVSALNHPNIMTIHDICEEEDEIFIVSEFIDGELLSEKIKDNPVKEKDLINTAIGIADGLHAAHEKEIIHRDIKSQNIMCSKTNQAKILDFGLAKQKGMSRVTKTGSTLGTEGYMSPEQVEGLETDKRSDIFSFGVVLYEMATGRLPFEGDHEAAILYSIMNEEPIPITTRNPNMPHEMERIIHKALEKNVKDRYQHADEMLADLRKLKKEGSSEKPPQPKSKKRFPTYITSIFIVFIIVAIINSIFKKDDIDSTVSKKSIAVLPFTSIDRTEESEIFGDGIHDDILTQISKIHDLKVIARTSVLRYRNTEMSIKEIAQELGVGSILEGSVRRFGERIRIVAQLIDPETEEHLWAETYDRNYADIFTIQSDVANKIAGALQATLTLEEKQSIDAIPTDNMEAYNHYLRGNVYNWKALREEPIRSAIQFYNKAIELDPNFTLAYARLSIAYMRMLWFAADYNYLQMAKETLDKATMVDANHPDIHLAFGYYYYYGFRDFDKALEEFSIALEAQPNNDELIEAIGWIKRRQGDWDESIRHTKLAIELNPHLAARCAGLAMTYIYLRNWTEAIRYSEKCINIDPEDVDGYSMRGLIMFLQEGDVEKVRQYARDNINPADSSKFIDEYGFIEMLGRNYQRVINIYKEKEKQYLLEIALAYKLLGQREAAEQYYDSARIQYEKQINNFPEDGDSYSFLGIAYAGLGRIEDAHKAGKHGVELIPVSKDALSGSALLINLARIYAMTGQSELAISQIESLLSMPSLLTVQLLKLQAVWDPLRDHPRFQELIEKYSDSGN